MENSNWKEFYIEDFAEIVNHKRIPLSTLERTNRKGSFPYYGASGIIDYVDNYIFEGKHILVSEDGENLRSRNTPIAFQADGRFWVNNHAHILKCKKDFYNEILIYYFQNLDLNPFLTGAVQPKLNKASLTKIPIILPADENHQKAIASVLSSLDDKIDLLHQQNQTLEALAETLFRQWFIEDAKEDWEEVPLKDLVKLLQGKYVSAEKISEAINLDQKFPLYGGNGIRGYLNTYQFKERKVAITCRGNGCGLIQLLNPFSNISNSCIVLNNDENLSIWFIYYYSKTLDFFSVTSGSAQPQITITDIGTLNITIPDIEILVKFDKIVKSYHDKIFENQQQIQTLTQLRDTLLPKLMSGEVRVKV